jgi:hypothetical protein
MTISFGTFASGLASAALVLALASSGAQSAASRHDRLDIVPQQSAQLLFPDAPDGVDPMVTGPVSASFKQRQDEAGCARMQWPDISAACYPN